MATSQARGPNVAAVVTVVSDGDAGYPQYVDGDGPEPAAPAGFRYFRSHAPTTGQSGWVLMTTEQSPFGEV